MEQGTAPSRLSANQSAVLRVLAVADRPMSAYRILDALAGSGITAPSQVYRALKALVALGLVRRLESMNAFIACDGPDPAEGVGMLICPCCRRVAEVDLSDLANAMVLAAQAKGFAIERAMIEAHGRCAECQLEHP